jgi:hypothetical protein
MNTQELQERGERLKKQERSAVNAVREMVNTLNVCARVYRKDMNYTVSARYVDGVLDTVVIRDTLTDKVVMNCDTCTAIENLCDMLNKLGRK